MHIFYTPDIEKLSQLPEEESQHCVKVLRLTEGERIRLTDGKGNFYDAEITYAHPKKCEVKIVEKIEQKKQWDFVIKMAVAPTKNMDRIEWFAEKATEIGMDTFTCLKCRYSERKEVKPIRLEKILISAMKQSLKARIPELEGMTPFKEVVTAPFEGRKFIAYCSDVHPKRLIKDLYKKGEDVLILIGPEGDFSDEEVALALANGFEPISLGESRLRTETAALAALQTVHVLNQ
ncbi:MAG TPA: 16S rRNA (uracil(1498)-N(3))-methyltransferase [Porphyromonadaceae bacterium]|nr:16S rRNA (uracil(1498)-N(3))-methyltransferase [Porphyromonadaceae bacterium]